MTKRIKVLQEEEGLQSNVSGFIGHFWSLKGMGFGISCFVEDIDYNVMLGGKRKW